MEDIEGDGGFPGTWFIENRSSQGPGQSAERWAASCLRFLKTVSAVIASRYTARRNSGRIIVSDRTGEDMASRVSVIGDREVEVILEVPAGWLFEEPKFQSRFLSRLLSNPSSQESRRDPPGPASDAPTISGRRLVQFVHCASLFEKRARQFSSVPPAAFFMAPALRGSGFQVAVDSLLLEPFAEPGLFTERSRNESRERLDRIMERNPFCIAFTAMDFYLEELRCLLREVRARDESVLIALGGPLVTLYPEKAPVYLPEGNVFIRGEADVAFGEVLACLTPLHAARDLSEEEARRFEDRAGLFLRFGDTVCVAGLDRMNRINSLDELFRDGVDLDFIRKQHVGNGFYLHTTRGCPYRCSFCSKVHGSHVRAMSAETILRILSAYQARVDEIEKREALSEQERRKAFQVSFSDDDFLLARQRAKGFLQRIRETPFHLKAVPAGIPSFLSGGSKGPGRARAFDAALFEAIEAAGDRILSFEIGTDDFTEPELFRLAKGYPGGYTLGEIVEVLRRLEQLRINNRHFVILSNPATRWSDLFEKLITLEALSGSYPHFYPDPNPFVLAPLGTPLFSELVGQGRADTLVKRVFTVPGFPEFTHWVFNMALPREDLFSTDRVSTVGFFNRLCDLLKSRYRFSIFDDAYLHYIDVCNNKNPAYAETDERERILDQIIRAARLRGERIVSRVNDATVPSDGSIGTGRLRSLANMICGMFLLRETAGALFPEEAFHEKRQSLRELVDEMSAQLESWASPEGSLPEAASQGLRQALGFGMAQVRLYQSGGLANQANLLADRFVRKTEARLLELGLPEDAREWRALCSRGAELVRLDVAEDKRDAKFVEDEEKVGRLFGLMARVDPELARPASWLPFVRAELVLGRTLRDDFLSASETRVPVYDGIARLPLDFMDRFQQEFRVSPFLDKDGFATAMLSKFLASQEIPHLAEMFGTSVFQGLEPLLRALVPSGLTEFSRWFFGRRVKA